MLTDKELKDAAHACRVWPCETCKKYIPKLLEEVEHYRKRIMRSKNKECFCGKIGVKRDTSAGGWICQACIDIKNQNKGRKRQNRGSHGIVYKINCIQL